MTHSVPTLDDLISLNHEIAALVKAGVPLELGLRGLFGGTRSRLSRLTNRLATRLGSGMTLPDALAQEGPAVSPVYTAVVKAGLAAGKLPQALESLAISGQVIQETRRRVFLAMLYPIICALTAYWTLSFFVWYIAPRILGAAEDFPQNWSTQWLRTVVDNAEVITFYIPLAAFSLLVLSYLLRHSVARGFWQFLTSFRWIIGQSLNWAQFTELLALQVEHETPLPEAFVLAADATDDPRWHRQARLVADKLKNGSTLLEALKPAKMLPPLVRWMLASGERQGTLAVTLRRLADLYRRRALRLAAVVRIWLPVAMTFAFTTVIGLTYGLAFFIPLRAFLIGLTQE